jgi:predicted RNase H-like HicB family nuclease
MEVGGIIMQSMLNATEVRANFGGFIDTIVREKPQAIKRNRDIIMAFSKQQMKELLSVYELTFEYEQDEDGRYAGSVEQIEDIVADAESLEDLKYELSRNLIEYALDYEANYSRYYNTPNRHKHAPYILRVLLEEDIESVAAMFHA